MKKTTNLARMLLLWCPHKDDHTICHTCHEAALSSTIDRLKKAEETVAAYNETAEGATSFLTVAKEEVERLAGEVAWCENTHANACYTGDCDGRPEYCETHARPEMMRQDRIKELKATLKEMREALEWVINVAHGVGKAGGKPESGEWVDALKSGMEALAKSKEVEEENYEQNR